MLKNTIIFTNPAGFLSKIAYLSKSKQLRNVLSHFLWPNGLFNATNIRYLRESQIPQSVNPIQYFAKQQAINKDFGHLKYKLRKEKMLNNALDVAYTITLLFLQ